MKILILGGGQDAFILSYLFNKKFNIRTALSVRDFSINKSIPNSLVFSKRKLSGLLKRTQINSTEYLLSNKSFSRDLWDQGPSPKKPIFIIF